MNTITQEEALEVENLYEILTDSDADIIRNEHRRGATFYRQCVIEIDTKTCEEWSIPIEYAGLWKSSLYVYSDEYHNNFDMFPFTRVTKTTKEVVTTKTVVSYEDVK